MNRTLRAKSAFLIAALCAPATAFAAQTSAPAAAPPAETAVAPVTDTLTLLCKGTYYFQNTGATPNTAPATQQTQDTQFSIKISYAGQYMDLIPGEWPALRVSKDNPAVVRSVSFLADDDMVKAMFAPTNGQEFQGTLRNMGLGKLAGDYKEIITINRKTGDFTYPNTSGRCEKVETAVKENKF